MPVPKYDAVFEYSNPTTLRITIAKTSRYSDLIEALEYSGMATHINQFPNKMIVEVVRNPCWTIEQFEEDMSDIFSRSVGINSIGGMIGGIGPVGDISATGLEDEQEENNATINILNDNN